MGSFWARTSLSVTVVNVSFNSTGCAPDDLIRAESHWYWGTQSMTEWRMGRKSNHDHYYHKLPQSIRLQWFFLRRLERVFLCCSVCETMEDYKEGYLMVWTNYISPCSSIDGLYFKGTCDVISVTMATHKVHKSVL